MIEGKFEDSGAILKYGQVGGGPGSFIGPVHRAAIAMNGQAKMVAGSFSDKPEETYMTARQLDVDESRAYETFEEMAAREAEREDGIDFVSITVPNHLHYQVARTFLEKGINVVCDKPLCFTIEEAEELIKLASEKNLEFMVTYTYTGYPMVREARNLVETGELGKLRVVMAEYAQDWLADPIELDGQKQATWRTNPKYSGISNCVGDIGTHVENLVHFVTGLEIEKLSARLETFVKGRKLDDNAYINVKYSSGASGNYWSSQVAIGNENGLKLRVFGTEGAIEWEQENPNVLKFVKKGGVTQLLTRGNGYLSDSAQAYTRLPSGHPEGYFEAFANLYSSYCNRLIAKKNNLKDDEIFPTPIDGARGVKFIHDCVESSNKGSEWIDGSFKI